MHAKRRPVALGLVASLSRPGSNVTGITNLVGELSAKQMQLLHELVPNAPFGILADPAFPATPAMIADLQGAARSLGRQLIVENARTDSDLETAFASFSRQHVGAVLVSTGTFFARRTEQLAALAAYYALPAIYAYREYALSGGLMRRETSRSTGRAGDETRSGHEPQDRQGARPHHPGNAAGHGR